MSPISILSRLERTDGSTMNFLDSTATTDAVKYKVQVAPSFTNGNLFINKINFDSDNAYIPAASSVITAIEVTA